jgi:lysophospholipase L1-like esterase
MWSPDRSELSLAPILGWLGLAVVAGVFVIDGSVGALTGRLTAAADRGQPMAHSALGALAPGADPQGAPDDGSDGDGEVPTPAHLSTSAGALALAKADAELGSEASLIGAGAGVGPGAAATGTGGGASGAPRLPPLFDPCVEGQGEHCRRALDPFRAALARSRKGDLGRPLRLSMFGDSVVATDEIPGRLRHLAVAELGDGGPGFVYAHSPHRFCAHEAITRSSTGSWTSFAVSMASVRDRLYGYGGSTAQTDGGSVTTKIKGEPATHIAVHYLAQPRGGQLEILHDREDVPLTTIDSRAETAAPAVAIAEVADGAHSVALRTTGNVRLFGLVLERDRGAVVDNLGIVSVTAKNFSRNDHAHWASQIRARQPDLVMVMIGANEAQWLQGGTNEMRDYTERYTELLAPIRAAGSSCLVISPLDQVEITDGRVVSRKISTRIVESQRAAAVAAGCGFFDSLSWMGGPGSAARWRRRSWLSGDYIHLTRKGSEQLGDALFTALFAPPSAEK